MADTVNSRQLGLGALHTLQDLRVRHRDNAAAARRPLSYERAKRAFSRFSSNKNCFDCRQALTIVDNDIDDIDRLRSTMETLTIDTKVRAWVCTKFGIFLCPLCAGNHRRIGVDVTFVRSPFLDALTEEHLAALELGGNQSVIDFIGPLNVPGIRAGVEHALPPEQLRDIYTSEIFTEYKHDLHRRVERTLQLRRSEVNAELMHKREIEDLAVDNFGGFSGREAGLITTPAGGASRQLANENSDGATEQPLLLETGEPIVSVSAGFSFAAAVTTSGQLYVWGEHANDIDGLSAVFGERANEDTAAALRADRRSLVYKSYIVCISEKLRKEENKEDQSRVAPIEVRSIAEGQYSPAPLSWHQKQFWIGRGFVSVTCGSNHVVALTDAGGCYTWGSGWNFRLGHGTEGHERSPRLIEALAALKERIVSAAAGSTFTVVVSSKGTAYSWGESYAGALGQSGFERSRFPEVVSAPAIYRDVYTSPSASYVLAISDDNRLFGWGDTSFGQLGYVDRDGKWNSQATEMALPFQKDGTETLKYIACGKFHTLYLTSVGSVYLRGSSVFINSRRLPIDLGNATRVIGFGEGCRYGRAIAVAASDTASYVLTEDGELYVWGLVERGESKFILENPTPVHLTDKKDIVHISGGSGSTDLVFLRYNASSEVFNLSESLRMLWKVACNIEDPGFNPSVTEGSCRIFFRDESAPLRVHFAIVESLSHSLAMFLKKASDSEGRIYLSSSWMPDYLFPLREMSRKNGFSFFSIFYNVVNSSCSETTENVLRYLKDQKWSQLLPELESKCVHAKRKKSENFKKGATRLQDYFSRGRIEGGLLGKLKSTIAKGLDVISPFSVKKRGMEGLKERYANMWVQVLGDGLLNLLVDCNANADPPTKMTTDFCLLIKERRFFCHKALLAVRSEFFSTVLERDNFKESMANAMEVTDEAVTQEGVFLFLCLLYSPASFMAIDQSIDNLEAIFSRTGLRTPALTEIPKLCAEVQSLADVYCCEAVGHAAASLCLCSQITEENFDVTAAVILVGVASVETGDGVLNRTQATGSEFHLESLKELVCSSSCILDKLGALERLRTLIVESCDDSM